MKGSWSMFSLYKNDNQLMLDATDRIVVGLYTKMRENHCRTVLINGCSSGCGVTTTSINLSIALAEAGWKTVLLDCDMRKNIKYKRISEEGNTGLAEYLKDEAQIGDIIYETNHGLLKYIPSGIADINPVRLQCSSQMEDLISNLRETYDFVIIDTPSISIVPDAEILLPLVDGIVFVVALEETGKTQLNDAKEIIEKYKDNFMGFIVNKTQVKQYKRYIKDFDYFREKRQSKKFNEDIKKVRCKDEKNK